MIVTVSISSQPSSLTVNVGQVATFKFHVAEVGECAAEGKVLRIQPGGVFIVELERANRVYRDFVLSLAA